MSENQGRILLNQASLKVWQAEHANRRTSMLMAGLFRGWMPKAYFSRGKPRILYVGKSTSGRFEELDAERNSFNSKGAFWAFARQIAMKLTGVEEGLPCIAWSNISKLSAPQIAACASLLTGVEEIATETLELEIEETDPHVIAFVTGHFGEQVVRQIAGGDKDSDWKKSEDQTNVLGENDIWWKHRADGRAVLWMRHPQGATLMQRNFAAKKISSLIKI